MKKEIKIILIFIQILIIGYLISVCWEDFSSIPNTWIDLSILVVILAVFIFWGRTLYHQFKSLFI